MHTHRLRRAVLHPSLVLVSDKNNSRSSDGTVDIDALIKHFSDEESGGGGGKNVFAEDILTNLGEDIHTECPICLDVMQQPMLIPVCMHQWYANITVA
jgi:DNA repair protein RAD5